MKNSRDAIKEIESLEKYSQFRLNARKSINSKISNKDEKHLIEDIEYRIKRVFEKLGKPNYNASNYEEQMDKLKNTFIKAIQSDDRIYDFFRYRISDLLDDQLSRAEITSMAEFGIRKMDPKYDENKLDSYPLKRQLSQDYLDLVTLLLRSNYRQ
ncbi:hypothetical protein O9G_003958 [Rozella allomycis CSF55]|uniref:Uncharacterized protein n=1 Tax=Rozella allomycis (strain CSF55) TaxID=988480 RepID=A0A075AYZ7_ROZAC|nr:hypothetical protein O9G_003958 [Rozella allomycis CSF55]|eukprot:EPZ35525.1 hypothetical protein O9G_003958 [Rozella allomycis CSF55]